MRLQLTGALGEGISSLSTGKQKAICSDHADSPHANKGFFCSMKIHTTESIAREFNSEVVVPVLWHPPKFERADWMWIKNVAQSGPDQDGRLADIKIGSGPSARRLTCMHRTQPHRNFTVFYRRIAETTVLIIGLGSHNVSNKQYSVQWADGCKNRIILSSTQKIGDHYLVNPIGGCFAFRTLDPLINAGFLCNPI